MNYTTNQKGLITEMQVMLKFIELGYNVSQPLNTDSRYDCIVDVNGNLLKIQIKTAHLHQHTKDAINIKCHSTTTTQNHRKQTGYTKKDIDYFATIWNNNLYLIPVNQCSNEKTLHLTKDKNRGNWSYLEDYDAKEILKTL